MATLQSLLDGKAQLVEGYLDSYFTTRYSEDLPDQGFSDLLASMRYSALLGGKRFRPALAMMVAEALGHSSERVLPYAAAVECIHTYSLIHDDLPAMDNDDFRRGKPTNHKVYGEATAVLAGDALLTEAFQIIAQAYFGEANVGLQVVSDLAIAAGFRGMVGGQAIDMRAKDASIKRQELERMHRLKTGALIGAAAIGAARLCFASAELLAEVKAFAENLGLAFQVADDLHDFDPANPEAGYPGLIGFDNAKLYLKELTEACLENLKAWPEAAEPLRDLARFNQQRTF